MTSGGSEFLNNYVYQDQQHPWPTTVNGPHLQPQNFDSHMQQKNVQTMAQQGIVTVAGILIFI